MAARPKSEDILRKNAEARAELQPRPASTELGRTKLVGDWQDFLQRTQKDAAARGLVMETVSLPQDGVIGAVSQWMDNLFGPDPPTEAPYLAF